VSTANGKGERPYLRGSFFNTLLGSGNRPRAYDFRHHFALTNLNRWIVSGVEIGSKLPYLSRYMGHSRPANTDYYLHLVPEFFPTFCEKVRSTEAVLPEVLDGRQ
jgi:integrase